MSDEPWPVEWNRGTLGPVVLAVVAQGETYGYAIVQRLAAAGFGVVKGSTLYPLLNRYELDGVLHATWREGDGGPGRKFFGLTPAGHDLLAARRADWQRFTQVVGTLIAPGEDSR